MATAATFTEYSFAQFAEIRNRKELCDFAFEVDGKSYFAHKVVLAASIPYFEQLFDGSGCHDDDDEDNSAAPISPSNEVLETLLTFVYSGLKPEASAVATENFLPPMVGDADLEALLQQRFAKFDQFRRSEKLCDFTFMIKDTVFSAHKIILAASIPLFADLFLRPDQSNVLDYTVLNRLSPSAVRTLLQFAYSGEFNPTSAMQEEEEEGNDLRGVILAAKLFQVQKLEEMCLDFLRQRLNADVVQQYWPFAHANDLFELQEMLKSYMCANFQEFIGTPAFLALTTAELEDFLVRDDLSVTSEDDVFRAIVSWVDNAGAYRPSSTRNIASTRRAEAFSRLFSRLRICKLSEDCREQILSHPLCRAHLDCADLELQTKLLRMTGMLNEQQVISQAAQSDRVYRQISTDVLYIVKRDGHFEDALVDIFNPLENTWQEFCHAPISRCTQNIVLNNRIYTLNYQSNQISVNIFDVTTKRSKRGVAAGFSSYGYSAVAIHDHILVLTEADRKSDWWAYDTLCNKWKKGPKQEPFREGSCLVTLQDRYVLVIGGRSEQYQQLKTVQYCEPGHAVVNDQDAFFRVVGSTWTHPAPPLPQLLMECQAAELDGRIFVVGCRATEFTAVRVAVFCPQMGGGGGGGGDDDEPVRLGGQWFLLSPESSPSSLSSNLVSHAGRLYLLGQHVYGFGSDVSLCFQPCSEQELENMKQAEDNNAAEGVPSEAVTNKTGETSVSAHSAASNNLDSEKPEEKEEEVEEEEERDKSTILPDSDPFSSWRWRPFCAPDGLSDVCFAGVIKVTLPIGRK